MEGAILAFTSSSIPSNSFTIMSSICLKSVYLFICLTYYFYLHFLLPPLSCLNFIWYGFVDSLPTLLHLLTIFFLLFCSMFVLNIGFFMIFQHCILFFSTLRSWFYYCLCTFSGISFRFSFISMMCAVRKLSLVMFHFIFWDLFEMFWLFIENTPSVRNKAWILFSNGFSFCIYLF